MGDYLIHCKGRRLDRQRFPRFEIEVETATRETRTPHQINQADAVGAALTQGIERLFRQSASGSPAHGPSHNALPAPRKILREIGR